jgi:Tol biopolymer transport system component
MRPERSVLPAAAGVLLLCAGSQAQSTSRASVDSFGAQGDLASQTSVISADGRFVAFRSDATNLVSGDTNAATDVFVRDLVSGTTELASVASGGWQGSGWSADAAISADGRIVVFLSAAPDLVAGDSNGLVDVFARDRLLGTTERVNVSSAGAQANAGPFNCSVSGDGRFVAFASNATNLVAGDSNGVRDCFVRDRLLGTTELLSLDSSGAQGDGDSGIFACALSLDGRCVAFTSRATNLVAGDTNQAQDVFVRDRLNGTTERVSLGAGGAQANAHSSACSISADGRFVAFQSGASDLVAGDTNSFDDIFVRDRLAGTTQRVSVASGGAQSNGFSLAPSISANGQCVAFWAYATNLVPGDTNGWGDSFVHDRLNGVTERVSVDSGGAQANFGGFDPSISSDGQLVVFFGPATSLVAGDTNGFDDVFVRDRGAPPPSGFCLGDGSAGACPCGNNGAGGRGCQNSAATGGAQLTAAGSASLLGDTLVLTSSGELPSVLSTFLQGNASIAPVVFGDGLRCTGGLLKRLYIRNAIGGVISAPQVGELSVSARSAALGDTIVAGTTRYYQTYYRDPQLAFCANPPGNSWNVSSGLSIVWNP